jgi:hypothetical protein
MSRTEEIAAAAAPWVIDHGMEYAEAKRRAARDLGLRGELPDNEQVEDAVREHLAVFCADTQPGELRALRELAVTWMDRLAEFRPHLTGAVWRGTATRVSSLRLELYCDDPKATELMLLDRGVDYDPGVWTRPDGREVPLLTLDTPCPALGERVTVHLFVMDADDLRGGLKPDARGRTWLGDLAGLRRRLLEVDPNE